MKFCFLLKESDIGRPIKQFSLPFDYSDFYLDAAGVLSKKVPIEKEIQHHNGQWFLCRITPYRNAMRQIQGLVLTFMDISDRKDAEIEVHHASRRFSEALNAIPQSILMVDQEGDIVFANKHMYTVSGMDFVNEKIADFVSKKRAESN